MKIQFRHVNVLYWVPFMIALSTEALFIDPESAVGTVIFKIDAKVPLIISLLLVVVIKILHGTKGAHWKIAEVGQALNVQVIVQKPPEPVQNTSPTGFSTNSQKQTTKYSNDIVTNHLNMFCLKTILVRDIL